MKIPKTQLAAAERLVELRSERRANQTPDRYLKGPRRVKARCRPSKRSPTLLSCKATGYVRAQCCWDRKGEPFRNAIADEQWRVRAGRKPKVVDPDYGFANFLEADNYNGCSVGESLNC